MTVSDVVAAFGGTGQMARTFGVLPSAVSNWKKAGRLPDRLHYRISREAMNRGIEIPHEFFAEAASGAGHRPEGPAVSQDAA